MGRRTRMTGRKADPLEAHGPMGGMLRLSITMSLDGYVAGHTTQERSYAMTRPFPRAQRALVAFSILFALLVGPASPPARGQDRPAGFVKEKLDRIPALLKEAV